MKKTLFIYLLISLVSCKNVAENEDVDTIASAIDSTAIAVDTIVPTTISSGLTLAERNEKLITAIKNTEGTLDADVRKDILTVQVLSVEPEEAQKIATGILNEIKKYKENEHIKTVMVCDIDYKLLGYAGDKK